jgi:tRNA uridine 5-carboxymethylaminomethyl modification enzyme
MFTSRAEHRLLLREDNADLRLTPAGRELGLVNDERWDFFERKRRLSDEEVARLERTRVYPADVPEEWTQRVLGGPLGRDATAFDLLRRPEVSYDSLRELIGAGEEPGDDRLLSQVRAQVEVRAKYAGYIERQEDEIERQRCNEETALPADLDFSQIAGLSTEVRIKLAEIRPATLGQAGRIPGVTPAALSILLIHLKKRSLARSRVA